jgi:hypothetical protein
MRVSPFYVRILTAAHGRYGPDGGPVQGSLPVPAAVRIRLSLTGLVAGAEGELASNRLGYGAMRLTGDGM